MRVERTTDQPYRGCASWYRDNARHLRSRYLLSALPTAEAVSPVCSLSKAVLQRIDRLSLVISYYACFYAASALLLNKHISAKTHSGVIGQFSEQIVRSGLVSVEDFRVYAKLLNWRSKGDYNDLYDFCKEDVIPMMPKVRHFIDVVAGLIKV